MNSKLNNEQKKIFDYIEKSLRDKKNPLNLFISGPSGTGKSFLLRHLMKSNNNYKYKCCAVAPCGYSAINIDGKAVGALFRFNKNADFSPKKRIQELADVEVLFIDAIQMLPGKHFEVIDQILRRHKKSEEAFGGIHMITFGDLYQLSPRTNSNGENFYVYQTSLWSEFELIEMETIMTQQCDDFKNALNALRVGDETVLDSYFNKKLSTEFTLNVNNFKKIENFITFNNKQINEINNTVTELCLKTEESSVIKAKSKVVTKTSMAGVRESSARQIIPDVLNVTVNTRFMYKQDFSPNFRNGTLGIIREIHPDRLSVSLDNIDGKTYPMVPIQLYFKSGDPSESWARKQNPEVERRSGYPIVVSFALDIFFFHGRIVNEAAIYLTNKMAAGQLYVALSRVKLPENLHISQLLEKKHLVINHDANEIYETMRERNLLSLF